jgi:actin-related protein 8
VQFEFFCFRKRTQNLNFVLVSRFNDSEDMLEDTWNMEYAGGNAGVGIWDSYYPVYPTRLKKYDNVGLAEAIVSSILSTGL